LKETIASLPQEGDAMQLLESMSHRNNACYNCPYACNTFVKYREAANTMAAKGVDEPGCMVTDLSGFMGFSFLGKDAAPALEKCFRLGLEPTGASQLVKAAGSKDRSSAEEKLDQLAQSGGHLKDANLPHFYQMSPWPCAPSLESSLIQASGTFSNAVPFKPVVVAFKDFGVSDAPVDRAEWWLRRQALAYTLGICPIFTLVSPEMSEERLAELIASSAAWDAFTVEQLREVGKEVVRRSLQMSEKVGEVHATLEVEGFDSARDELRARFS
jgi:aldehyde:ferredoxin oxidoreductase